MTISSNDNKQEKKQNKTGERHMHPFTPEIILLFSKSFVLHK